MIRITGQIRSTDSVQLDGNYGPYETIQEAHEYLSGLMPAQNKIGVTVGVQPSGSTTITEYWYQGGTDKQHLVKKQTAVEVDSEPEEGSPKAVSSGGVYTALQGKANTSDIPDISKDITNDANSDTKATSPKAVKTYVDNSLTNKQNIINIDNMLSADLIQNGEINRVVTQSEKDAWNNPLAKVTYVGTNVTTGFPDVVNPEVDVIYACLRLSQDQGINSAYNFYTYKEGNWQNISQGSKGDGNFTFIKFSEDIPVQDSDIHDNFNPNSDRYIGVYNGLLSEAPTNYQSYNWGKFNGESALEIYNKLHSEDTPLTEAEFIDMLKATYPMKYVGYDSTADSANVGDELNSLDGNTAGSTYEHGLYLMPNADPDNDTPTGSVLFICVNKGENNYKWVKMGNMNTPNNLVTKEDIVDNVETGGSEKVLSAQQGKILGWKTQLADVTEEKVEDGEVEIGKFVAVRYPTNEQFPGTIKSDDTNTNNITTIELDGAEKYLRFNGIAPESIGCAFYDDETDNDYPNGHPIYTLGFTDIYGVKEYIVKVPYGAKRFITTSRRGALLQSDFYCYKIYGKPIDKPSSDADVVIKQDDDIAKMIVKMGGLKDISLTKLPFYFKKKGYWNKDTNSIGVSTTNAVDYINIEGYDKVAFLSRVNKAANSTYGYGFADNLDESGNPIGKTSYACDYDESLTDNVWKTYVVDVPEGKKYLLVTVGNSLGKDSVQFYCYGVKGTTIKDDVLAEVLSEVEGRFLPADALKDYYTETHGTNYLNKNDFLPGYYINNGVYQPHSAGIMSNRLYLEDGKTYTIQGCVIYRPTDFRKILYQRFKDNDEGNNDFSYATTYASFAGAEIQGQIGSHVNSSYGKITFTYKNEGEAYIRFVLQGNYTLYRDLMQLEEGEEATTPQPYEVIEELKLATKEDIDALNRKIDGISFPETTSLNLNSRLTVAIDKGLPRVRSQFNQDSDMIITLYNMDLMGNTSKKSGLTFGSVYIGDKQSDNSSIMVSSNKVNPQSIGDMLGSCNTINFGPIMAQHGYALLKSIVDKADWTDANLGDINNFINQPITDNENRAYHIGKIEETSYSDTTTDGNGNPVTITVPAIAIYLVPDLENTTEGEEAPSFSFWGAFYERINYPTTLTIGSSQLTIKKKSRFDVPIQKVIRTDFIINGKRLNYNEINSLTYTCECDTFEVVQYIEGKKPWGVTNASDWFGDTVPDTGNLVIWQKSFNFFVGGCTVNTSFNVNYPFIFNHWYCCVPITPIPTTINGTAYHSISYMPKVKKSVDGEIMDYGFASDSDEGQIEVLRNASQLYNEAVLPDRGITVLKDTSSNAGKYLIGMAGGFSLTRGISTNTYRINHYDDNTAACIFRRDLNNKWYFQLIVGNQFSVNSQITPDNVLNCTCYFSWFDPNQNYGDQVYWYKESDYYVVYCHSQSISNKKEITLHPSFEGMQVVETIEKTDGATLLTTVVTGGKLYVKYEANDSGQANFITMKLK